MALVYKAWSIRCEDGVYCYGIEFLSLSLIWLEKDEQRESVDCVKRVWTV